tara:strand:+ start:1077 stop:1523 length:447 start_codon:yes stop_codon:yes gene_type:complete
MGKSLEQKIEARIRQAEDRRIEYRARVIAEGLGSGGSYVMEGGRGEEIKYTYEGNNLVIEDSSFYIEESDGAVAGTGTGIKYNGEEVFKTGGGRMSVYVPGERSWERVLNKLYDEAIPALEEKQRKRKKGELKKKEAEERKEAKKWGL